MALDSTAFPAINATLNGAAAILLLSGRRLISQRRITAHRNTMIAAVITSALFLTSYLYYHLVLHTGVTHFQGKGFIRPLYFALLLSHTVLAAAIVPMILITLYNGLRRRDLKHRRIARWTFPLWLYVSVTGVLIYFMLYKWYAV